MQNTSYIVRYVNKYVYRLSLKAIFYELSSSYLDLYRLNGTLKLSILSVHCIESAYRPSYK